MSFRTGGLAEKRHRRKRWRQVAAMAEADCRGLDRAHWNERVAVQPGSGSSYVLDAPRAVPAGLCPVSPAARWC
ncbi:hypothetical protein GCM10011504_32770 [Siccirubricoccus deserti]|nr:hypothetical protein GCM10011504_32770 [Siccirubricoccus deserti]